MKPKSARYTATVNGRQFHANRLPMLQGQIERLNGSHPAVLTAYGQQVFVGTLSGLLEKIEQGAYRNPTIAAA